MEYRLESDSVGEKQVPKVAYYGVQSLRAGENFNITNRSLPEVQIKALAEIKKACAIINKEEGTLPSEIAAVIIKACDKIIEGNFHDQFIVDQIQGGAGTSTNMNANEVIANIALEILGKEKGNYRFCHPNDHVNLAQSTNDVYPTSVKMSIYRTTLVLINKLDQLYNALMKKSQEFYDVLKLGRTQLMDAVPITLGQEFHAYASVVKRDRDRIEKTLSEILTVNMAATAVGTGINSSEYYVKNIVPKIAEVSGIPIVRAKDRIDATQNIDCFSVVSSALKTCAISLSKMSNDIRLMNSGPKAGLGEITIPAKQNGSSIMPGKINPVIPEVMSQCAYAVMGNDFAVTMACEAGQLELNAFEPIVFNRINESINLLTNGVDTMIVNCIEGIVANEERCKELLDNSTGYVTALCPVLGYKKTATIAKTFLKNGVPIIDEAKKYGLGEREIKNIFSPEKLTRQFASL